MGCRASVHRLDAFFVEYRVAMLDNASKKMGLCAISFVFSEITLCIKHWQRLTAINFRFNRRDQLG